MSNTAPTAQTRFADCASQFAALDALPKRLRRTLAAAPFSYDAARVLDLWRQVRREDVVLRVIRQRIEKDLQNPVDGTAALYGAAHPDASRPAWL